MLNRFFYSLAFSMVLLTYSLCGWANSINVPPLSVNTVSADFNGDGHDDLAVLSIGSPGLLTTYLNDGQNNFSQSQQFPLSFKGNLLMRAAVGSFSSSGHSDIIISDPKGLQLIIFSNDGTGHFTAQTPFTTLENSTVFAVGNFKGNGRRDVANINGALSQIAFYFGDGNNSFTDGPTISTSQIPSFIAAGDLRKLGYDDIVVAYGFANQIQIFFNNGSGSFTASNVYNVGDFPLGIAIGDVNNDTYPDIVVSNMNSNSVSVLLNKGGSNAGIFNTATSYQTQNAPLSLALIGTHGSFDIVTTNEANSTISRFVNKGDGTFDAASNHNATNAPINISTGNLVYFVLNFSSYSIDVNPILQGVATTTVLTQSSSTSQYGDPVTFTAVVSPVTASSNTPTGTVSFYNGLNLIGTSTLSGGTATLTTSTLPGGSDVILAVYSGDSNFNSSTSAPVTHLVNKQTTSATLSSSSDPSSMTEAVTFTLTLSSSGGNVPTGTVTFSIDGTPYATVAVENGIASWTTFFITLGKHTIQATYNGDVSHEPTTATLIQTVVTGVLPPTCASGVQKLKYSPKKHPKYVNVLSWKAPSVGPRPVKYCVYRNARLNRLVGCVKADNCDTQFTYHLEDKKVKKGEMTTYYIVSVDEFGLKSDPTIVVVVPK